MIPSEFRHCIMAKEHPQDDGQPPRTGAGARLSRGSARSSTHTRACGDAAMLRKKREDLLGDGDGATISALLRPTERRRGALRRSGSARTEWTSPAGRGLKLSSSCTEQQEEQASDGPLGTRRWWAGASLLPSCIMEEGRGTTAGVRVTRHLWK